jgi:hypothetical protein
LATEQVDALTSDCKDAMAGWRAREKALLVHACAAEEEATVAQREKIAR